MEVPYACPLYPWSHAHSPLATPFPPRSVPTVARRLPHTSQINPSATPSALWQTQSAPPYPFLFSNSPQMPPKEANLRQDTPSSSATCSPNPNPDTNTWCRDSHHLLKNRNVSPSSGSGWAVSSESLTPLPSLSEGGATAYGWTAPPSRFERQLEGSRLRRSQKGTQGL